MKFKEVINAPLTNIYAMWELQLVMEHLEFTEDDELIEVGTGNGFASFILSKYVKRVVGIDISKPMIDLLNKNPKPNNVEFCRIDATTEPPKELLNKFDKCICIDTLQYVKSPKNLIKFTIKVLKLGGKLAISFPLMNPFRNKKYFTKEEVYELFKKEDNLKFDINAFRFRRSTFLIGTVYAKLQSILETTGDPDRFEEEVCFKMITNPKPIHKLYRLGTVLLFKMGGSSYVRDENGDRILIIGKKVKE